MKKNVIPKLTFSKAPPSSSIFIWMLGVQSNLHSQFKLYLRILSKHCKTKAVRLFYLLSRYGLLLWLFQYVINSYKSRRFIRRIVNHISSTDLSLKKTLFYFIFRVTQNAIHYVAFSCILFSVLRRMLYIMLPSLVFYFPCYTECYTLCCLLLYLCLFYVCTGLVQDMGAQIPWGQFVRDAVPKCFLVPQIFNNFFVYPVSIFSGWKYAHIHIFRLEIRIGRGSDLFLDWEKNRV